MKRYRNTFRFMLHLKAPDPSERAKFLGEEFYSWPNGKVVHASSVVCGPAKSYSASPSVLVHSIECAQGNPRNRSAIPLIIWLSSVFDSKTACTTESPESATCSVSTPRKTRAR